MLPKPPISDTSTPFSAPLCCIIRSSFSFPLKTHFLRAFWFCSLISSHGLPVFISYFLSPFLWVRLLLEFQQVSSHDIIFEQWIFWPLVLSLVVGSFLRWIINLYGLYAGIRPDFIFAFLVIGFLIWAVWFVHSEVIMCFEIQYMSWWFVLFH